MNQPPHFHIHYGDPDELDEDESLYTSLTPVPRLDAALTEVTTYLREQQALVASEHVASLDSFRACKDALSLLDRMDELGADIINQVGIEIELEEGMAISIIPCDYNDCGDK